jgi:hypothetical protein
MWMLDYKGEIYLGNKLLTSDGYSQLLHGWSCIQQSP